MKIPHWIQKIVRREPPKSSTPSLSVRENFLKFLKKPTPEGFKSLRQQVAASDRYAPYSNEPDMLMAALCAGEPQAAIDLFWRSFPNLLLSPLAHFILSQAYLGLKREDEAEGEKAMGRLIMKSILATGKGTKKRPYAVMRIEDEKDVLGALKKQASAQFLVRDKSRIFDLMECSDGSEVYFDITLMFGRGIEKEALAVAE
ncbi:MAG: hypothetical protein MUD09_00055 [Desulfobacterales bacterium]|jgi:hypothetical protein|nr:hypothetical protein [Desulfobacterales bacterium]